MNLAVTLYHLESEEIKIDVEARFEGDALVIDGYDIGKSVKEYWGDSDYEYTVTVPPEGVLMLYPLLQVEEDDKQVLLNEIANRFHTNTCYSDFRNFLDDNQIPCSGFTWA